MEAGRGRALADDVNAVGSLCWGRCGIVVDGG